jgi:hypothetical protein
MMLITGPAMRSPIPPRRYRWPLRVQTINAVIRPTNISRIISMKIIVRSSFPLPAKARPVAGLSCLKLRCLAQEPASSLSEESYMMSGAIPPILAGKRRTFSGASLGSISELSGVRPSALFGMRRARPEIQAERSPLAPVGRQCRRGYYLDPRCGGSKQVRRSSAAIRALLNAPVAMIPWHVERFRVQPFGISI